MNEFLPQLKKLSPIATGKNSKSMRGKEIFFMLKAGDNDVCIIPVDKKQQPVEADFHYFSGDTAQLLRSLNSIKEDMAFNISWDDNDTEDSSPPTPCRDFSTLRCLAHWMTSTQARKLIYNIISSLKLHKDKGWVDDLSMVSLNMRFS